MICPKCGHEISEGHLMCEKCGTEINIVPDYEIEVENSINETLSTIIEEITPEQRDANKEFSKSKISRKPKNKKKGIHKNYLISACIMLFLFVALFFVAFILYSNNSINYQLKKAYKYLDVKKYDEALKHITKAEKIKNDDKKIILAKAEVYSSMDDNDKAKDLLLYYIDNKSMDYPTKEMFYSRLISLYENEKEYKEINELLCKCTDESILKNFAKYSAIAPTFSLATGSYDCETTLEIESSSIGDIYYTTDGTTPSKKNGILYSGSILLKSGEYDIKAVFINDYGIMSAVSNSYYLIGTTNTMAPIVEPQSGTYDKPIEVMVSAPENYKIYYTVDGSDPNIENALRYKGIITVPVGHFNYCFMSVDENGVCSEVVKRSYTVDIETKVTPQMAVTNIYSVLKNVGILRDVSGKGAQNEGTYTYNYDSIVEIPNLGYYYKIDEFLKDNDGNTKATGLLYAVDVNSCATFRLTVNVDGSWGLIPLG